MHNELFTIRKKLDKAYAIVNVKGKVKQIKDNKFFKGKCEY